MVKKISKKLANTIGEKLNNDKDQIDIYAYGLEIIIGSILKLILLISLSLAFGIFKTTALCLIVFIIFRHLGGGVHMSTYYRCLTTGVIMFMVLGKMASIDIPWDILIILIFITIFLGIYTIFKWVPAGTEKKRVSDKETIIKLKKESFMVLILWMFIQSFFVKYQLKSYSLSITLGALTSFFLISPWGYWVIYTLDNTINKGKKGGIENV